LADFAFSAISVHERLRGDQTPRAEPTHALRGEPCALVGSRYKGHETRNVIIAHKGFVRDRAVVNGGMMDFEG